MKSLLTLIDRHMTNSLVVTTKNVRITTSIVDTKYAPMINVVITDATIIKGIGMLITAIGGLVFLYWKRKNPSCTIH